ncbi:hypothetical protein Tco_0002781 [Tanacetum coccineum]
MDDLMVDMRSALRHKVKTTDGPTTEQCYEKLKLVGLRSTDPVFLAAFNIFGQSRQMREAWMTLPSEPDVLKGWIELTGVAHDFRNLVRSNKKSKCIISITPSRQDSRRDSEYIPSRMIPSTGRRRKSIMETARGFLSKMAYLAYFFLF